MRDLRDSYRWQPRLLSFDGIDIEAPLEGTLLAIRNRDVPGVIGRVGTILGEHRINIANFALGRANGRVNADEGSTAGTARRSPAPSCTRRPTAQPWR